MRKVMVAVALLAGIAYAGERMTTVYKLTKLSPTEVAIYCTNGGDPAGNKVGETLVISCGR